MPFPEISLSTSILEILSAPTSEVAVPITVAPEPPKVNAIAFPIPLVAPVTRTIFPSSIRYFLDCRF